MISALVAWLIQKGLPGWVAKLAVAALILIIVAALLGSAYALIRVGGEKAGAAKVETRMADQHTAAVADARHDEQMAQAATNRIGAEIVQRDAVTAAATRTTIEDMHHAFDAAPPAAAGSLPAAPIDELRARLNAAIDRASRAADSAAAADGNHAD
ncbi:hypothetical protein [Sphingomonas morindae]|uniref:Uncharacterized protein n=1 Tax=Sphingomonas morindae TaxID=1541170 RepID=A0ABY4X3Y4_9SPHN|nr:hypothetical protein [Sphingomonas morindae]USI71602.1 hypothetical protein LHA26_09660 [Sphingomonas morindae]